MENENQMEPIEKRQPTLPLIPAADGSSPFDSSRKIRTDGSEYWSARDCYELLGYTAWENAKISIVRAMAACENSGFPASDHFRGVTKMVDIGSGALRAVQDYELDRRAMYLWTMNCDPRKPEIAVAQMYFAIRTRQAELMIAGKIPVPKPPPSSHPPMLMSMDQRIKLMRESERIFKRYGMDDRDKIALVDFARNNLLIASGKAYQDVHECGVFISLRVKELGYKGKYRESEIGKSVKAEYRKANGGREPGKRNEFVNGVAIEVADYKMEDLPIVDAGIHAYFAKRDQA